MKSNYLFIRLAVLMLGFSFLTACNKDKEDAAAVQEQQDLAAAQSTVELLSEIQDVNSLVSTLDLPGMQQMPSMGGRKAAACGNTTYTFDDNSEVQAITVDYGTGSTCEDGKLRKGKISFTIGSTKESLFSIGVQFIGYESEGKKLSGTYTIGINIEDSDDENSMKYVYSYVFKDATLTFADGTKVSWNSNYLLTIGFIMTDTSLTYTYAMTGGVSGIGRQNNAFSAEITSPLVADFSCRYGLTKGMYLIKTAKHPDATYDFGNGTCDDIATLTINGKSHEIKITN